PGVAGGVGIDDGPQRQVGATERLAQRDDHVARLEGPARRAGEQRREQEEVRVVDERDTRAGGRKLALERSGGVQAAVAPARDDHVPRHGRTVHVWSPAARVPAVALPLAGPYTSGPPPP